MFGRQEIGCIHGQVQSRPLPGDAVPARRFGPCELVDRDIVFLDEDQVLAVTEPIAQGTVALDRQHKKGRGIAFHAGPDVVCSFVVRIHDERVCARRQHGTCEADVMWAGKVHDRIVHIPRIAEGPSVEINRFVSRVIEFDELPF